MIKSEKIEEGKTYKVSNALINSIKTELGKQEAEKYNRMWKLPQRIYGNRSPAESFHILFPDDVTPASIVDIGCGCGRVMLKFLEKGFRPYLLDIAPNCLDEEVREKLGDNFEVANLWEDWGRFDFLFQYGFCCDVMEHIPTLMVDQFLGQISNHCKYVFFSICNVQDEWGKNIDEDLHLTIQPFLWWKEKMEQMGTILDGRDVLNYSIFFVEIRKWAE